MQLLTVGGTLNAGGTGEMSHRAGAQVDHVAALDVVTGEGEPVSCSPSQNETLFQMTLAGMGQCAVILRAHLRLIRAPRSVAVRTLLYHEINDLLSDSKQLVANESVNTIGAELTRANASWRLELRVGSFTSSSDTDAPPLPDGLHFDSELAQARTSYQDYLRRRTRSVRAALATRQPNPSLILTLPPALTRALLEQVLSSAEMSVGIWRVELLPWLTAHFAQPLHSMPDSPVAFSVRLQRRASAMNAPDHLAMMRANEELVRTYLPAGAKVYPPFAPPLSQDEWKLQYGSSWSRFHSAKRRFDPHDILTPGAGIFPTP